MKYIVGDIVILNPGIEDNKFTGGLGNMEGHRAQEGIVRRITNGEILIVDFPACDGFYVREHELMFADTGDHFKIDNSIMQI